MKKTYHIVGYPENFKVTTARTYTHAVVIQYASEGWDRIAGFCGSYALAVKCEAARISENKRWNGNAPMTTKIVEVEEVIKPSRNRKG